MNECLITKLKSSINDASLLKVGECRITKIATATAASDLVITMGFKTKSTVSIVNDGYITDSTLTNNLGKTLDFTANVDKTFYVSSGSILSFDKYEINYIEFDAASVELDVFVYANSIKRIESSRSEIIGELKEISHLVELNQLTLIPTAEAKNKLSGNLSDIKGLTNLVGLNVAKSNITGDISSLIDMTKMGYLTLSDTTIGGSIESFVNGQIANGRTSGSIRFGFPKACKNITYKGVSLSTSSEIPTNTGNSTLSWTSDGTITWT